MMDNIGQLFKELDLKTGSCLKLSEDAQSIYAGQDNIIALLKILKEKHGYNMLADITAVEYDDHFEMVYHLMKLENAELVRIKVELSGDMPVIPSITSLWKASDVQEREIFDLMGINFKGHKNLKRILCPDDFEGHPLRKDFKLNKPDRF